MIEPTEDEEGRTGGQARYTLQGGSWCELKAWPVWCAGSTRQSICINITLVCG